MLRHKTVQEYEKGVPISSLPQMFQDAVHFTTVLRCQHFWVDSLCIIQDSEEDKAVEITKMKDIYQGSYLVIAAADAKNCYEGLYKTRPCSGVPDLSFKWWDPTCQKEFSANLRVEVIPLTEDNMSLELEPFNLQFLNGPLGRRAWTLQERILPTRIVHFSDNQLVWECYSRTAYESTTEPAEYQRPKTETVFGKEQPTPQFNSTSLDEQSESDEMNIDTGSRVIQTGRNNQNEDSNDEEWEDVASEDTMSEGDMSENNMCEDDEVGYGTDGSDADVTELLLHNLQEKGIPALIEHCATSALELYFAWYNILMQYSSRVMSFDQDKIAAIGGIMDLFQNRIGGRMIYGIWENDLMRGLLWAADASSLGFTIRTQFPAPSWSWARIHRRVGYFWNEVWSSHESWLLPVILQGPYSATINCDQIEDGILMISALCRTVDPCKLNCYSHYDSCNREVRFTFVEDDNHYRIYFDSLDDYAPLMTNNSQNTSPLLLLQVGEFAPDSIYSPPGHVVGFILQQKNSRSVFERVGIFKIDSGYAAFNPNVWTPGKVTVM